MEPHQANIYLPSEQIPHTVTCNTNHLMNQTQVKFKSAVWMHCHKMIFQDLPSPNFAAATASRRSQLRAFALPASPERTCCANKSGAGCCCTLFVPDAAIQRAWHYNDGENLARNPEHEQVAAKCVLATSSLGCGEHVTSYISWQPFSSWGPPCPPCENA